MLTSNLIRETRPGSQSFARPPDGGCAGGRHPQAGRPEARHADEVEALKPNGIPSRKDRSNEGCDFPPGKIEAMRTVGDKIATSIRKYRRSSRSSRDDGVLPNIRMAHPFGKDENENVVLRTMGELPKFDSSQKGTGTGAGAGIIDFERGVKITGSPLYVLSGRERACSGR